GDRVPRRPCPGLLDPAHAGEGDGRRHRETREAVTLASIPSPPQAVWYLGPIPIRAYALCILLGVVVAIWYGDRRWRQRGGRPGAIGDVAIWAVPFGLVGARLYHVITDPELYFEAGENPWAAFYIWRGGLGIWGAVAL